MRHRTGYKKLSKAADQRIALLRGLTLSLIKEGKIRTSKKRGQEVRRIVEKLVALSKKGGLASLRKAVSMIPAKGPVSEFFKTAPERFRGHAGGCTRLTVIGTRRGDAADMVLVELL